MSITTEPSAQVQSMSSGDGFVAGSLLAVTVVLTAYQVVAAAIIPPLAVFAVLFGAAAALVRWRRSRWTLITAAVLALVYLVGGVQFFLVNLAHPESPVSFLAEAFLLLALVSVLAGVVGGLRRAGPGDRRPIAIGAVALAGLAVVLSTIAALGASSDARQPDDVAISIVNSGFPADIEVAGDQAVLWVDNQDPFHHTFVIEGTDIREVLPAATAIRVPVGLAAGTYRMWCDVPGHESMEGKLHVR